MTARHWLQSTEVAGRVNFDHVTNVTDVSRHSSKGRRTAVSRSSVRLSVRDVDVPWQYKGSSLLGVPTPAI